MSGADEVYPYLAELIGTTIFLFLALGVNASAKLKDGLFKDAGPVYIITGWGLAFILPAIVFGKASGAYFNPVIPLAYAVIGKFPWSMVPGYMLAELLGAFLGACLAYVYYKDHFDATDDSEVKLHVFASYPTIPNMGANLFSEIMATFIFVILIINLTYHIQVFGLYNVLAGPCLMCIAYSLGATTGYAVNPAADLGPRLAYQILPIPGKGDCGWAYAIIPVVGPFIGGVLGALVANWILSFPPLT